MPTTAAYGTWKSPISARSLATAGVGLSHVRPSNGSVAWIESRPSEGGRCAIVRKNASGELVDDLPEEFNVRTRAHEYGGGAFVVRGEASYFSSFADQRLYRWDASRRPEPITPEPSAPGADRFADVDVTADGKTLVCVRERHRADGEPVNELVAMPTDGSAEPAVVATGADFYSYPRISPNGDAIAWTSWNHPDMPWDATELWVADFDPSTLADEPAAVLRNARRVAGGPEESVFQPAWSPDGILHWISDTTGWWNLYALEGADSSARARAIAPTDADYGSPQWVFAMSRYAFLSQNRIAAVATREGADSLEIIDRSSGERTPVDLPYSSYSSAELHSDGEDTLYFLASSPYAATELVRFETRTGEREVLRRSLPLPDDAAYLSAPEAITFPTSGRQSAHAFFYPPVNRDYAGPSDEKPPLVVMSHGGPTGHSSPELSMKVQYWTSRGFAVVDVNYRGSTGYGRAYRDSLRSRWGIADTDDCIAAARFLARGGRADPDRLVIRGGSAGGYTTLCALVFHDVFAAGASYYGVAELASLAEETHKFESRYLDRLIGPYPERKDLYAQRSPLHFTDRLSCPVILLQGLEDKVVPPSQAESMVAALEAKGLPHAYVAFAGEQHGFRRAETIQRAIEAEYYFYARVFGIEPADDLDPIDIAHL